ncbi:MAG: endonuclease/exonuclease/phosphatase family protein [Geobacteraceae bacterium]
MAMKLSMTVVWLIILTGLYGGILATITVLNHYGADRWLFGALNLYLPQAIWLIPGILLICFALMFARGWTWLPALCVLWVLGPIMGLSWPMHARPEMSGTTAIRIMTCNAKYGKRDVTPLIDDMIRYKPEVVVLQDMLKPLSGPLENFFREWHVYSHGQYVIASRFPLFEPERLKISFPGEKHSCLRFRVHIGGSIVTFYNVHLKTPREGLNAFRRIKRRPTYLPKAISRFENNVEARLIQARTLIKYLRQEQGPVIVAGDLNSPDASQVCAMLRDANFHDAFDEGGKGYGYTYGHFLLQHRIPWIHVSWMRIDHIFMSPQLNSVHCWTGTDKASDHRPVFADILLTRPKIH